MAKIDIDLSDLLTPIRKMREEMEQLVATMRQLSQYTQQGGGRPFGGTPFSAGRGLSVVPNNMQGQGPLILPNNVIPFGGVPPTNINPAGVRPSPIDLFGQQLGAAKQGVNIVSAFAGQAGMYSPQAKREMEDLHKILKNHTDKSGQLISSFLKKSESDLAEVSRLLSEKNRELALAMASNADNIKELTDSADALSKQFNTLKNAVGSMTDAAQDFVKQSGGSGGGEGGGGGGWWSKYGGAVGRGAAGVAATAAFGFHLAGAYSGIQAFGYQQNLAALREIPQNIATAESLKYQRYMTTAAPMTGEQFVEAYGNLLTPGERPFSYLGIGNRQATRSMTERLMTEELKASKAELDSAVFNSISSGIGQITGGATSIGMGAAAISAGVPTVGLPLMAQGAGNILNAPVNMFSAVTQAQSNLYGQSQGGYTNAPLAGLVFNNANEAAAQQVTRFISYQARAGEENQRFLMNAESQGIRARKLALGIDENLAALRAQTAATAMAGGAAVTGFEPFNAFAQGPSSILRQAIMNSPNSVPNKLISRYAQLGYSIPEVGQIYNQYASILGTTKGAGAMLSLSRAGVGTVEQLAGNILGISAVSGRKGDEKQLENILAKAFEAGLKGAPSIQRFSQAAIEMSSALKLQSPTMAANMLSALTSAMAGKTGSPLMALGQAQAGISALAAATGATTGMMGTIKVLSGAAQGLGMGAMGLVAGSNVVQVQDAMAQVAAQLAGPKKDMDYTKLTGLARQLVGTQVRAGMSPEAAMNKVRDILQAQMGAQAAPFAAGYKLLTGKSLSSIQAEAKALLKSGESEKLRDLFAQFRGETAGLVGLETEGAAEALIMAGMPVSDTKRAQRLLRQAKGAGAAKVAADQATINYKKILSQAALEARPGMTQTNVETSKLLETATALGLSGTPEQQIAQLKQAAGVEKDKPISFGQLSSAISVLAGKESGVGTRISVVENFGDLAIARLSYAILGKQVPKSEEFGQGGEDNTNRSITPTKRK